MTPSRQSLMSLMALVTVTMFAGCTEDGDDGLDKAPPSISIIATNARCQVGRNILPVSPVDAIRAQVMATNGVAVDGLQTISVVINTTDSNNSSGVFNTGSVEITQNEEAEGRARVQFVTNNEEVSGPIPFEGGVASTRIYCLSPGIVQLEAVVESYKPGGDGDAVTVRSREPFPVRCVSQAEFADDCGIVNFDGGGTGDAGDAGDGGNAGDGGSDADAGDGGDAAVPVAWTIEYLNPPPASLEIGARGTSSTRPTSVLITFAVVTEGAGLAGVPVDFTLVGTSVTGARLTPTTGMTNSEGLVNVRLAAGNAPGVVSVRATATFQGEEQTVGSPTITIRGGTPSARGFTLRCDSYVPGFSQRPSVSEWEIGIGPLGKCVVQLSDYQGGRVDLNTQVFFATEAGNIDQAGLTGLEGTVEAPMGQGEPAPVDTDPQPVLVGRSANGEDRIEEAGLSPRDGRVTVLARTRGEENFTDIDGDGGYNPDVDDFDEDLHDLGEPFVDANSNGEWDVGELFRDLDADGSWSPGNGVWDADTDIWQSVEVVWTGQLNRDKSYIEVKCLDNACRNGDEAPPRGCAAVVQAGVGAVIDIEALFVDSNFNCPGAFNEGGVRIEVGGGLQLIQGFPDSGGWAAGIVNLCERPVGDGETALGAPIVNWAVIDSSAPLVEGAVPPMRAPITISATSATPAGNTVTIAQTLFICFAGP